MTITVVCPYCSHGNVVQYPTGASTAQTNELREKASCRGCASTFALCFKVKKVRESAGKRDARTKLLAKQEAQRKALRAEPGCDCDASDFAHGEYQHRWRCKTRGDDASGGAP
jgi:hypothetical protein